MWKGDGWCQWTILHIIHNYKSKIMEMKSILLITLVCDCFLCISSWGCLDVDPYRLDNNKIFFCVFIPDVNELWEHLISCKLDAYLLIVVFVYNLNIVKVMYLTHVVTGFD